MRRPPAAVYRTVVVSVSLLFAEFGSVDVDVTDAVFVTGPFVGDLTTIVIVADVPAAMSPRLHVTALLSGLAAQLPFVDEAEANPVFFGS